MGHAMFPELILSPHLRVGTWGLLVSLACLSVLWLGRANATARGLPPEAVTRIWPALLWGGFAGAHLYYLLAVAGWPLHRLPLAAVANVFSGTAVQGGILGGAAAAALSCRLEGLPLLSLCDALAPAGALAQGITRVGCFAAGCCFGRPTGSILGVVIASPYADAAAPRGVPLHPAQLYETVLDLLLAAALQRRLRERREPGTLFAEYVMGASAIRFVVQFFRDDDAGSLISGLAHSQFMAVALFAAAALYRAAGRARQEELV